MEPSIMITQRQRELRNGHTGCVLWMTGLSGAGKSTLAEALEDRLWHFGCRVAVLDGDVLRRGLCSGLGFSPQDRTENLRRAACTAKLLMEHGMIVVCSFITPTVWDREQIREQFMEPGAHTPRGLHTVYVKTSLQECQRRDPKGLYAKVAEGKIIEFTGISAPYDPPRMPDLELDTEEHDISWCTETLVTYTLQASHLRAPAYR
jgi:adenylyl-sulfate kinase